MSKLLFHKELQALAEVPGVRACAIVEVGTGLVWETCGGVPVADAMWEAAVDYWRLHRRNVARFEGLGELHVAALHHRDGMLVVMPCVAELDLIVACTAEHRSVDWRGWQDRLVQLGERLRAL